MRLLEINQYLCQVWVDLKLFNIDSIAEILRNVNELIKLTINNFFNKFQNNFDKFYNKTIYLTDPSIKHTES